MYPEAIVTMEAVINREGGDKYAYKYDLYEMCADFASGLAVRKKYQESKYYFQKALKYAVNEEQKEESQELLQAVEKKLKQG